MTLAHTESLLHPLRDNDATRLTSVYLVVFIFLISIIPVLKSSGESESMRYFLQLVLFSVFLLTFFVRSASFDGRVMTVLAFSPLLGFFVPPRRVGISFLLLAATLVLITAPRGGFSIKHLMRSNKSLRLLLRMYLAWLGGWTIISLAGVDAGNSIHQIALLLFLPLIAIILFLAEELTVGPDDWWAGIKAALWIAIVFTLIQIAFGLEYTLFPSLNQNVMLSAATQGMRYPGPFRDAQAFSQFLSVSLSFCLLYRPKGSTVSQIALGLLGFIILLLNGSRMAPFGLLVGVVAAALITPGGRTKVLIRLGLIAAFVLLVSFFVDVEKIVIVRRFLGTEQDASFRLGIWIKSFSIFRAHPWTGIGFENFSEVVLSFVNGGFWQSQQGIVVYNHPESGYLKILCETGIIGTTVFVGLIFMVLKQYWNVLRNVNLDASRKDFLAAGFAGYIALLMSQITVYTMNDPRILFLFGFCSAIPFLYWREKVRI